MRHACWYNLLSGLCAVALAQACALDPVPEPPEGNSVLPGFPSTMGVVGTAGTTAAGMEPMGGPSFPVAGEPTTAAPDSTPGIVAPTPGAGGAGTMAMGAGGMGSNPFLNMGGMASAAAGAPGAPPGGGTAGMPTCDPDAMDDMTADGGLPPCSEVPMGSLSMTVGGADCAWPGRGSNLPEGQVLQTAASAADAQLRVFVDHCTVAGNANTGYSVSGLIDMDTVVFEISTLAPVTSVGGAVDINYQEANPPLLLETPPTNAAHCSARAIEVVDVGGAIYLSFDCTELINPSVVGSTCQTVDARLILENCNR